MGPGHGWVRPQPPQAPAPRGGKGLGRAPAPWQRMPGPGCRHSSATARAHWQHLGAGAGWHDISSIQRFCSSSRAASLGRAAAAEGAISRKKPTTTTLKHLLRAQLPRPAQRPQSRQELLELPNGSLRDRSEAKSTRAPQHHPLQGSRVTTLPRSVPKAINPPSAPTASDHTFLREELLRGYLHLLLGSLKSSFSSTPRGRGSSAAPGSQSPGPGQLQPHRIM